MIHRRLGGADAWFTDRHGGVSAPPFGSRNLADHVGDDPAAVAENRRRTRAEIGHPTAQWIQPRHVHGTKVMAITGEDRDGEEADGAATHRSGLVVCALGADCAPIAIANDTACAAIHAGWRGAANGVVEAGVAAVRALGTGTVRAVVGPCICGSHYEFGAELLQELADQLGPTVVTASVTGTSALDLRCAIAVAFERADVADVEVLEVCTVESGDHYSYRRDGVTGRHGVVVVNR